MLNYAPQHIYNSSQVSQKQGEKWQANKTPQPRWGLKSLPCVGCHHAPGGDQGDWQVKYFLGVCLEGVLHQKLTKHKQP